MNANITLEAEARMILNDASGAGSTTNGNTWTFKAGSILHLATAQALLGSYDPGTGNTGKINPAQFNFEHLSHHGGARVDVARSRDFDRLRHTA